MLLKLMDFILSHKKFVFNGQNFLQVHGTAMGTRMAPSFAIIFMADLEGRLLSSSPQTPFFYRRYIDDILMI